MAVSSSMAKPALVEERVRLGPCNRQWQVGGDNVRCLLRTAEVRDVQRLDGHLQETSARVCVCDCVCACVCACECECVCVSVAGGKVCGLGWVGWGGGRTVCVCLHVEGGWEPGERINVAAPPGHGATLVTPAAANAANLRPVASACARPSGVSTRRWSSFEVSSYCPCRIRMMCRDGEACNQQPARTVSGLLSLLT